MRLMSRSRFWHSFADMQAVTRDGPLVLELNARPGLGIQVANRRGLRPLLEAVAGLTPPPDPAARVELGRRLSAELLAPPGATPPGRRPSGS